MKRLGILIFFTVPLFVSAQDMNFRKANWGATRQEVQDSEISKQLVNDTNILGYSTQLADLDCAVGYYFYNSVLYKGAYVITEQHSETNDYLLDYLKLKKLLIEKYGEPNINKVDWKSEAFKKDAKNFGLAVSVGQLKLYCIWNTGSSKIQIRIQGDNYEIDLKIIYESILLLEKMEKERKSAILEDL